jgi:hypothetical protein
MKTDNTDVMLRLIVLWVLSDTEGRGKGEETQYLTDTLVGKTYWKGAILKEEKTMRR